MNTAYITAYVVISALAALWFFGRWSRIFGVPVVEVKELPAFLAKAPLLLDVRTVREVESGGVEGAVHCPLDAAGSFEGERDRLILTFCLSGVRAYKAAETLRRRAFLRAYCFNGSFLELAKAVRRAKQEPV